MEDLDELKKKLQMNGGGKNSPLMNEINKVKGTPEVIDNFKTIVPGANPHIKTNDIIGKIGNATDRIDTKSIQKVLSGGFQDKIAKLIESRAASKLLKQAGSMGKAALGKIPVLGGLAVGLGTALSSGDVAAGEQAAIPLLNEAEDLGPARGSLEEMLENGTISPEQLEMLRNRFKNNG